jgi:hypothetical protein
MSHRHRLPIALAFLLFAATTAVPPARAEGPPVRGTPFLGAPGIHRSVAELMGDAAPRVGRDPRMAERRKQPHDRSGLPQAPDALPIAQWPPRPDRGFSSQSAEGGAAALTQPFSLTFTGATLFGTNPTFSFPPDCMGAVGPSQYVVAVNGRIVTFNKNTGAADGVMNLDIDVFFNSVRNGSSTSDPRIRYDRLSGRWFVVIINTSTPNRILIAVSDAASAGAISLSTIWTYFFIPIDTTPPAISNTCFADYPTLGVDANALYIGTNNFCGSPSQTFNSCDGFVVRKSSVLGAGPIVVTALRGLVPTAGSDGPYTPQGVDNFDPAATEGYFIGVSNQFFGRLVLRRVTDPGGAPAASGDITITTSSTSFPLKVPHLGNTGGANGQLSGLDDRLFAAHIRSNRLWTAHNIAVNNTGVATSGTRNGSRWYELQNVASPGIPAVFQSGTVFSASGSNTTDQPHWWIPSVMVSGQGHATMGFSNAGTNARANVAITGRLANDAFGTMFAPVLTTSSSTAYNPPSDPGSASIGRRWGDYSYTSLDPIDDMTTWTIQEFCDATNSYGCQVVKMTAPPPATPASATDVNAGEASAVTTVTGTAVSGSGFYDPGADLPGVPAFSHLAATVTNTGVTGTPPTVNSVTYVSPTQIQLDLNTTAASPNLPGEKYTVVVTNPDGQMISSAVLTVQSGVAGVEDPGPSRFGLEARGPNPASGPTQIEFSLSRPSEVRLAVVDVLGREVAVLARGAHPAGRHQVSWSGETPSGPAATGLYFLLYQAEGQTASRRIVRLR